MKLSIVIPTRNRAGALDATLAAFCAIIQASPRKRDVELVCVDNFSHDDTQAVCNRYANEHTFVRYFHHAEERHSAETSAFNAIDFASGEYVWLFGDDDTPLDGCIDTLLSALDEYSPSFALLNLLFDHRTQTTDYINSIEPLIYFPRGLDFFQRFGLVNAVTTISCICFRKSTFNRALFDEFAQISEIYSHTFALFANYHDVPVLFVARPVVKYHPNSEALELERIGGISRANGLSTYFSFGHGIARLIEAASRITGVSIATIADFEEMVVDKNTFRVHPMLLWTFIVRTFVMQYRSDVLNRFRADHVAELQAIAAQLSNSTARLCWDACLQINSPKSCAQGEVVVQRVLGILHNYEQAYFQSLRCEGPVKHVQSLYFQNGVVPFNFTSDGSSRKQPLPSVVVAIRIDDECEPSRVLAALENAQRRLKEIHVKWVLWNCRDPSRWQRTTSTIQILACDELSLHQLSELGEYVVFLRPNSLPFPNVLLFALNLLVHRGADAAVFSCGGDRDTTGKSNSLGDLPSVEVIREMRPEESRAVYSHFEASPSELPMIVATKSLLGRENARVLQINCPLSTDSLCTPRPCDELSRAADSILQPGVDMISTLNALNHLTMGGLLSGSAVAPVSAETLGEIYSSFEPDIETSVGALVIENLLLLLGTRHCWENTWMFNERLRTLLVADLHEFNSMLHSGTRFAQENSSLSTITPDTTLRKAQYELTEAYKATNPYLTRFAAWTTVLGLKISKRLLTAPPVDRTS